MSNLTSFILGVASSIVASIIIYSLRFNLGFIINLVFYRLYPNVSGEYRYYVYDRIRISKNEAKQDENKDGLIKKSGDKPTNQELLKWLKSKNNKPHILMKLKQFANKVSGEIYYIHKDSIKYVEKIYGKITPSRVLVLNSEAIDAEHHNFGTYLLNLTNDISIIKGTRSGLCIECGDATSDYILLEKNK